jgi:hypothetical protein
LLARICAEMECAAVQHLGKVLVVWRPNPEAKKPHRPREPAPPAPGPSVPRRRRPACGRRSTRYANAAAAHSRTCQSARAAPRASMRLPEGARCRRGAPRWGSTPAKRKSSFTPKTKPRSFKPNPREAGQETPSGGARP